MAPDEEPKEVSADPPAPPAEPLASSPADGDNPHEKLVASLRSQIDDLFSQVSQLNSKLVQSYDRVASLEDDMHVASSDLRASSIKISQLELERTQHLSALNTGLLVEKEHVTTELSRLMERVAEESAQRGQAETARQEIEKDLDDLSATLFNQANTMVAEARWQRAQSERKVVDVEQALKGAEEAVAVMQTQMQGLREEKEAADRELSELREKGKWVERGPAPPVNGEVVKFRELTVSHWPFQEFTVFLAHVKTSLTTAVSPLPPLLSTLLSQPFIARLVAEDSDPTIRLDLAPSLNWLTRRSVNAAIHFGQLTIEPVMATHLLQDPTLYAPTIPLTETPGNPSCALCGRPAFPQPSSSPPKHPKSRAPYIPPSNLQVFVFRLALPPPQKPSTTYPLCHDGWCLTRLRATCEMWRFVRTEIVEHAWGDAPHLSLDTGRPRSPPPPTPKRRVSSRVGSLWEMSIGALGGSSRGSTPPPEKITQSKSLPTSTTPVDQAPASLNGIIPSASVQPPPLPARSERRLSSTLQAKNAKAAGEGEAVHPASTADAKDETDEKNTTSVEPDEGKASAPPADDQSASVETEAVDATRPKTPSGTEESTAPHAKADSIVHPSSDPISQPDEFATPPEQASPAASPPSTPTRPAARLSSTSGPVTVALPPSPPTSRPSSPTPKDAPPPLPRRAAARPRAPAPSADNSIPSTESQSEAPSNDSPTPVKNTSSDHNQTEEKEAEHGRVHFAPPPAPSHFPPPPQRRRLSPAPKDVDKTWEEKTWKTLVGLREEMFWARVGGYHMSS